MLKETRVFIGGILSLHPLWQAWVFVLMIVNGIVPFCFLPRLEATVTLVAFFTGAILGLVLTRIHGFSKVLGLMHAPWIPMIVVLVALHPGFGGVNAYVIWLTSAIVVSTLAVLLDVLDVSLFLRAASSGDDLPQP